MDLEHSSHREQINNPIRLSLRVTGEKFIRLRPSHMPIDVMSSAGNGRFVSKLICFQRQIKKGQSTITLTNQKLSKTKSVPIIFLQVFESLIEGLQEISLAASRYGYIRKTGTRNVKTCPETQLKTSQYRERKTS
jgi:hypothetical protein